MRLLLTGSRHMPGHLRPDLAAEMHALVDEFGGDDRGVILVHGRCNPMRGDCWVAWADGDPADMCLSGADWHGHHIAIAAGWGVEEWPAHWSRGPKAGPARNKAMVAAGATVALAVRMRGVPSRGTDNCAHLARRAGIRVVEVTW